MNDYKNFCELAVAPVPTAGVKLARILLLVGYTLLTVIWLYIFALVTQTWVMLILLPFVLYALITLTWRFVRFDYEYSIEAGTLTIAKIYDGRSRRTLFCAELSDMLLLAPYREEKKRLAAPDIVKVSEYSAGPDSENAWIGIFPDKKSGKKAAVVFETNEEMLRILRICNPAAMNSGRSRA